MKRLVDFKTVTEKLAKNRQDCTNGFNSVNEIDLEKLRSGSNE